MYVCMYVCARARVRVCVFANHTVQDGTQSRTDICSVYVCVCGGGGGNKRSKFTDKAKINFQISLIHPFQRVGKALRLPFV